MSWWARRRGGRAGQCWSLLGATVATGAGWLGGHLAYNMGVGVDADAFEIGPANWTEVSGKIDPNGGVSGGIVDGVRVVAVQTGGTAHVLAGRCSHRGGPLSEGHRQGNCLVCPWHGSQFDLDSGVPAKGPASVPQPVYEARIEDGDLEVRRGSLGPCASGPYALAEATGSTPAHPQSCPYSSEPRAGSTPTGEEASIRPGRPRRVARALCSPVPHGRSQQRLLPPARDRHLRGMEGQDPDDFIVSVKARPLPDAHPAAPGTSGAHQPPS